MEGGEMEGWSADRIRFLERSEFDRLRNDPEALWRLAEERLARSARDLADLRAEQELEQARTEQAVHVLDRRIAELRAEAAAAQSQLRELQSAHGELAAERERLALSAQSARVAERAADDARVAAEAARDGAMRDRSDIVAALADREARLEAAIADRARDAEDAARLRSEKHAAEQRASALEAEGVRAAYELESLRAARTSLEAQLAALRSETESKAAEYAGARRELTDRARAQAAALEEKTADAAGAQHLAGVLRGQNDRLGAQNRELLAETANLKEQVLVKDRLFEQELAARDRLAAVLERESSQNAARVLELEGTVADLQTSFELARASFQQANAALADENALLLRNHETVAAENAELRMRVEYGRGVPASGALAAIIAASGGSSSSPSSSSADDPASGRYDALPASFSAIAGSPLVPLASSSSPSAVSAQLKYELAARELLEAKQENKRLNSYVQQILREIQAKAPLIIEQKKESERVLQKHAALAKQLQNLMSEHEDMRIEKAVLAQERTSLRQQAEDLSSQVQVLLRTVQLLEAHVDSATVADLYASVPAPVRKSADAASGAVLAAGGIVDAAHIIEARLVTFHDIVELQRNNIQLIRVVRELSSDSERAGREASERRLAEAMQKFEEAKMVGTAHADRVRALVRERDLYKTLVAQMSAGTPVAPSVVDAVVARSDNGGAGAGAASATALQQLHEEFEQYRTERARSDKMWREEQTRLQNSLGEVQVARAKSEARNEYLAEEVQRERERADTFRHELTMLKDRHAAATTSLIDHQREMETLQSANMRLSGELQRVSAMEAAISAELQVLRRADERLLVELASAKESAASQQNLAESLQALFRSREAVLEADRARLERELASARDAARGDLGRLESRVETATAERQANELRANELQRSLDLRAAELAAAREQSARLESRVEALHAEVDRLYRMPPAALPVPAAAAASPVQAAAINSAPDSGLAALRLKLLSDDLDAAKETVRQLQDSVDAYRRIAQEKETACDDLKAAVDRMEELRASELKTRGSRIAELESEVSSLKAELTEALGSYCGRQSDLEEQLRAAQRRVSALEGELQATSAHAELLDERLRAAHQSVKDAHELRDEAQRSYHQELQSHSRDSEELQRTKRELVAARALVEDSGAERDSARMELQLATELRAEEQKRHAAVAEELISRVDLLGRENAVLHRQYQAAIVAGAPRVAPGSPALGGAADEGVDAGGDGLAGRPAEELVDLLRQLRGEREKFAAKLDIALQDASRYRSQYEYIRSQLEEYRGKFQEVQAEVLRLRHSEDEVQKLREALEQLRLVRESNAGLRFEKDALEKRLEDELQRNEQRRQAVPRLKEVIAGLKKERDAVRADLEARDSELERWKQRVEQMADRYKRIDPEEHERLRAQLAAAVEEVEVQKAAASQSAEMDQKRMRAIAQLKQIRAGLDAKVAELKAEVELNVAAVAEARTAADAARAEAAAAAERAGAAAALIAEKEAQADRFRRAAVSLKKKLDAAAPVSATEAPGPVAETSTEPASAPAPPDAATTPPVKRARVVAAPASAPAAAAGSEVSAEAAPADDSPAAPVRKRTRSETAAATPALAELDAASAAPAETPAEAMETEPATPSGGGPAAKPRRRRSAAAAKPATE